MAPAYLRRYTTSSILPNGRDSTTSNPLLPRTAENADSPTCLTLTSSQLLISRPAFIAILTICISITLLSLATLTVVLYRQRTHHRKISAWGRRSRYGARVSMMRKEVDDSYSRQYKGVWVGETAENPEMGSESPVEMDIERRVWEVPAVPPKAAGRGKKVGSLFFDPESGLWVPKK